MKQIILAMLAIILFSTIDARAGVVVKKHHTTLAIVSPVPNASQQANSTKRTVFQKVAEAVGNGINTLPRTVYIIMAIVGLGWLAMGINSNFEGRKWALSLLLYILGWIPGLVYTLIMMKRYYK
ncbi:MAG: hypothetical protein KF744_09460 [Taibaiella sp.]|nr:hypothetical protein [Taibaiella sp.]